MSEPFADLTWDRSTGEIAGRGHAVSLRPFTVPAFTALWKAKGGVVRLSDRYGHSRANNMAAKLRSALARFDLTVKGENSYGGHRLVDRRVEKEGSPS